MIKRGSVSLERSSFFFIFSCLIPVLFLVGGAFAQDSPRDNLREVFERKIEEIVDGVDGVVGLTVKDLATDETFSVHGEMVFTQASAIKLPILYELFRQVDQGGLALDTLITLQQSDVVPGSGVLQRLTPGMVTMSLLDYTTLMITQSDNTATNMLIDRVGMDNVNRSMDRLGLTETKLQRKMMDREAWLSDRENLSTPNEQARLLGLVYRGEGLRKESSEELLRILSIPKSSQIRALLPSGVRVAHKTGSVPGVVVDVGIVYLPGNPFIVAAMVNWLADSEEAGNAISRLSLAV